jgi:hypothetical protein
MDFRRRHASKKTARAAAVVDTSKHAIGNQAAARLVEWS